MSSTGVPRVSESPFIENIKGSEGKRGKSRGVYDSRVTQLNKSRLRLVEETYFQMYKLERFNVPTDEKISSTT